MPQRKPDRVIGLTKTRAFEKHLSTDRENRHSPCRDDNVLYVLYPFLLLEAKREKGSPGFEHIENQSAFPLFTLVKLQYDLHQRSTRNLNPLVWFLANQGDEWRLHAAVLDNLKYVCDRHPT